MAAWHQFPSPKFPNDPWNMPKFGMLCLVGSTENDPNPVQGVYVYPDFGNTLFVTPDKDQTPIDIKSGYWCEPGLTEHFVYHIHR